MPKIFREETIIISHDKISLNYFKIALGTRSITRLAQPGQFVNVRISEVLEPFLRRPFSIHRADGDALEILYEVIGKGTGILSQRKPGESLDIIGPLGSGFSLPATRYSLLVAGGMGVAPLVFLAERLVNSPQCPAAHRKNIVLIGAKTKKQILCEKEFKELDCDVKISTDDGSCGFKGRVTDLLKNFLSTVDSRQSTVYACGPHPMLKEIASISKKYGIPAQVSLEEHMACGTGACFGCAVKVKSKKSPPQSVAGPPRILAERVKNDFEYKRVCKDGPVFDAQKIVWANEDILDTMCQGLNS